MTKTARINTYLCKYKYRKYKNNQKKEFFHRPELLVKGKSFHPKEEIKKSKKRLSPYNPYLDIQDFANSLKITRKNRAKNDFFVPLSR